MSKPEEIQVFDYVNAEGSGDANVEESDKRLMELGYKPEFRREMSLFRVLGISFCAIGILTGSSAAFQAGLFSGGPLGKLQYPLRYDGKENLSAQGCFGDGIWGRVLAATGSVPLSSPLHCPNKVSVASVPSDGMTHLPVLVNGEPEKVDDKRASEILSLEDFEILVDLG
ncbi:hypothetical protein DFH05DRAFT_1560885 [Lentinula detonsa]|uniref:Uncharacterized protein n=1 Tax=Lentinula detonsa TaxID=2804962 RepID=A0A9W8P9L5_9AGAR|nr:hypothetical protein DFH05DRAFT_1560885 [Lentinula detonsa]